jgi:hypothetical protein
VGTLKRYSKALEYEYRVKTVALGTLKRYSDRIRAAAPTPSLLGWLALIGYVLSAMASVLEQPTTSRAAAWKMVVLMGPL